MDSKSVHPHEMGYFLKVSRLSESIRPDRQREMSDVPRIVKDNAHGAGGRCKPSKDNTDGSERVSLTGGFCTHPIHSHCLVSFPPVR